MFVLHGKTHTHHAIVSLAKEYHVITNPKNMYYVKHLKSLTKKIKQEIMKSLNKKKNYMGLLMINL